MARRDKYANSRSSCIAVLLVFFLSILFAYVAVPFLPFPTSLQRWMGSEPLMGYLACACLIAMFLWIIVSVYYSRLLPSRARFFRDGVRFFLAYSVLQGVATIPIKSLTLSDDKNQREFAASFGDDSQSLIIAAWFFAVCLKFGYALVIEKDQQKGKR